MYRGTCRCTSIYCIYTCIAALKTASVHIHVYVCHIHYKPLSLTSTERVLLAWLTLALVRAMGDPHSATSRCTKLCSGILSPTRATPGFRAGFSSGCLSNTVVIGPGRSWERRSDGTVTLAHLRTQEWQKHYTIHLHCEGIVQN